MIVARGEIGVKVMMEQCQRVLERRGMSDEWKDSVIAPIFKEKGDVMSGGSYREVKLLEHAMKIVERILQRRIRTLVNWKDTLESKGLNVNTRKTKAMESGSEGELFKSKIDPCGVCGRRLMLRTKCGN